MHAKHHNGPGNGYRSNSMGSVAAASRIPPESSMRGHRMYNSEYRNNNRGVYRTGGRSKQFQPPPPPTRDSDVFAEAGKLAAEYLVSKGVLPSNALSGKWQNDGRVSARFRLGNPGQDDVGPGRRRYSDEYNSMGSRSFTKERKKTGSSKNYGSENRELGRSVSLAERIRASSGMEGDSDASVGHRDGGNGEIPKFSPGEISQEVNSEARVESRLEKSTLLGNADAIASSLTKEKNLPSAADAEPMKKNDESEMVKEGRNDNDLQQKHDETKVTASLEGSLVREDRGDLLKHCKFVNVPTKARSSLTSKVSKGEKDPVNDDVNISKKEHLETSGVHVIDVDVSTSAASSRQSHEIKSLPFEKSLKASPGSSNFMLMDRVEKRAMDFSTDDKEYFKKLRQWVPPLDAQSHSPRTHSSSIENQQMLQEPSTSQSAQLTLSPNQKSFDISLFPRDHSDSSEFMEEKQLFPGSFKTCDLNLVGTSDVSENHDADPMLVFPSVTQTGKTATLIDVDLSISNNISLPNKYGKHGVNDSDIEVIDLEKDSSQEDKAFSNTRRRGDIVFTDLDGFANNVHSGNGISDAQDGYGLMLSEFLGNVSPNRNVPTDFTSLHNHMGLPNEEGFLGEDDSIYMSLGEIPISTPGLMGGAWEHPTQDYGKPF